MASKFTSPLLGYNNNVRHKNRVFHIQTEDSGIKHPHIITHLFMDGGRILKSVKKSYAEHVGVDGMTDIVKGMMKEQHKAMFIALRDGQFDSVVDGNNAASAAAAVAAASPISAPVAVPGSGEPAPITDAEGAPPVEAAEEEAAVDDSPLGLASAAGGDDEPAGSSPTIALLAPPVSPEMLSALGGDELPPPTKLGTGSQPPAKQSAGLSLDVDALQRASREDEGPSPLFRPPSDMPPPPENLFRDRPATGGYRAVPARQTEDTSRAAPRPAAPNASSAPNMPNVGAPPRPPPRPAVPRSEPPRRVAAPAPPAGESRYAPTRPAAIFAPARPAPSAPTSIFGGDLLSDKSLDEVILSYLAEDLEPEPNKK